VSEIESQMDSPWERSLKSRSKLQEERMSRMKGARPQVNSGRIWSSLRDNKLTSFIGMFLIDNKTHDDPEKRSYRLDYDEWKSLRKDANRTPPGCLPALQVDLQDISLFVIELSTWDEICRYVMSLEIRDD
jgi:hypothetical protein